MTTDDNGSRAKLRACLEILPDEIDDCLIEQPIYFHDVAEAYAGAVAARDEAELVLKETKADIDQQLRKKYGEEEVKFTEAGLEKELRTFPKIKKLERELLDLSAEAEKWLALKESFIQRSFMLRELVGKHIAELSNLGLERSAKGVRGNLADARYEKMERDRERELGHGRKVLKPRGA